MFPYLVPASYKTNCVLITRTSHLILFREIHIYFFCELYDPFQLSSGKYAEVLMVICNSKTKLVDTLGFHKCENPQYFLLGPDTL